MITIDQFKSVFPRCKDPKSWVQILKDNLMKYDIDTPQRIAMFLAQCGHESAGFSTFTENLNYSAKSLDIVFGKYFKNAGRNAEEYARKPEEIANIVYANRMGNTHAGDGWKYRGRGLIQMTGFNNYKAYSFDMNNTADSNPDIVSDEIKYTLTSAIWFWNKNKLNNYADKEDVKGCTKRINGGYFGLEDRISHYKEIMKYLGTEYKIKDETDNNDFDFDFAPNSVIRRGSTGEGVKIIQKELGISPNDGIFGLGTEKIVKEWQVKNGLTPDGIVGPKTLERMMNE